MGLVVDALEEAVAAGVLRSEDVTKEKLEGFLSRFGRDFYGVSDERQERIVLRKSGMTIQSSLRNEASSVEVIPFRRGKITWGVDWQ